MNDSNHYLPQFLLSRFRGNSLWELDKSTGKCESRCIRKAGRFIDFYPDAIEKGIMTKWDTGASDILRKCVYGRKLIALHPPQKRTLATWLALFFVRGPSNFQQVSEHVGTLTPDEMAKHIYRHPLTIIHDFWTHNSCYARLALRVLGRRYVNQYFLYRAERELRSKPAHDIVNPQTIFHWHIASKPHE